MSMREESTAPGLSARCGKGAAQEPGGPEQSTASRGKEPGRDERRRRGDAARFRLLQGGTLIEEPGEVLGFYGVDEGMGIDLPDGVHDLLAFVAGHHGIDEAAFLEWREVA